MRIRFTKQPSERSGGSAYEVGQVVDLVPTSAAKWLKRNVAVEVKGDAAVETAAIDPGEKAVPSAAAPRRVRKGKAD